MIFPSYLMYSGILAILVTWFLIVLPAYRKGIDIDDKDRDSISEITSISKQVKWKVNTGLIIGTVFQVIFLLVLIQKYDIDITSIGVLLFLFTNLLTILVAIFDEKRYYIAHVICTVSYFIIHPISLVLVGLQIGETEPLIRIVSLSIFVLYMIGHTLLYIKYKTGNSYSEVYSFLLLTIWTLVVIFI